MVYLQMIIIYNARDITEAHIVRGMLEARGIEAHVNGYYLQGGVGELAAHDFVSISVANNDADQARKLVEYYDSGMLTTGDTDDPDK